MKNSKKSPKYTVGLSFDVTEFPNFCAASIVHNVRIHNSRGLDYDVEAHTKLGLAEKLIQTILIDIFRNTGDPPGKILMADRVGGDIYKHIIDELPNNHIIEAEVEDSDSDIVTVDFRLLKGDVFYNNNSGNDVIIVELVNTDYEDSRK